MTAQDYIPTPVTISTSKTKVNGKVCYSHIVLERQTIYSICKAYGVTAEDLYKYNAGLQENGLKKNSIILIPTQEALENNSEKAQKEEKKLKKHTVKWYEGIEDVAEKYGVKAEDIMKLNGLEPGTDITRMKLLIPNTETTDAEVVTPAPAPAPAPVAAAKDTTLAEKELTMPADSTTLADSSATTEEKILTKESVNFALMLPLAATGTTSKVNYMDFYCGVLYALYTSSNAGIETDLKVFDTANDAVPEEEFFNGCDFAIGPVYAKDIEKIMAIAPADLTVISPLDHKAFKLARKYPNLIQAPTNRKYQYADLVEWMKSDLKEGDNILYITETNTRDTLATKEMTKTLKDAGVEYKKFSYTILQGRGISSAIFANMTKSGVNRVIIDSESEAWVNDLVRNLNILKRRAKITLYSPSKIRSFESIDAEALYATSLHTSMSYDINYDAPEVKDFLLKYRAIFHTEPSLFAFQGYDIATYFINLVHKYGADWKNMLTAANMSGLQTDFNFQKTDREGTVNQGVRRAEYSDL
jgi:LysM repeat protein